LEGAAEAGSKMGMDPSPRVFLRKNVILGELSCTVAQECDSKEFIVGRGDPAVGSEDSRGLIGAITTHDSIDC
jgi:hypothetical protein